MAVRALLLSLREQGFQLTPSGTAVRVTPASRLTPELVEIIQANKAALITEIRAQAKKVLDDTEREIMAMFGDPAWRQQWRDRFERHGSDGAIQNVHNGVDACLAVARDYCDVGDLDATHSACAFALDCAAGSLWDQGIQV